MSAEEPIAKRTALTSLSSLSVKDVPGGDSGTPQKIKFSFFYKRLWGLGLLDEGRFKLKLWQFWPESLKT